MTHHQSKRNTWDLPPITTSQMSYLYSMNVVYQLNLWSTYLCPTYDARFVVRYTIVNLNFWPMSFCYDFIRSLLTIRFTDRGGVSMMYGSSAVLRG